MEDPRGRQAATFGAAAERYDRTREAYPQELVDRILAACPGNGILDVGCGTGIAARQFQAAGATVLGVDVDARMAEFARSRGLAVEVAAFEDWDSEGRSFGAVVSGQAWHWIDAAAGAAKAGRLLPAGGVLAPFWHVFQPPPKVVSAFAEVYRRVIPDSPFRLHAMPAQSMDAYQGLFAKAMDGMNAARAFGAAEQWRFDWERHYTREQWLDQLPTSGALTSLPPEKLGQILDGMGEALDELGGGFTMKCATMAVVAVRTGAGPGQRLRVVRKGPLDWKNISAYSCA